MNSLINEFLLGAIVICCLMAGTFFLRFYRRTHDRLLAIFAIAFWVLALNWAALSFTERDEVRTWLYVVRLLAFMAILIGILDKNRSPNRT